MRFATSIAWFDENQRYLANELMALRQLLECYNAKLQGLREEDLDETSVSPVLGDGHSSMVGPPALNVLCATFQLSWFERNVLLMCAALELDRSFAYLYGVAQGDARATAL